MRPVLLDTPWLHVQAYGFFLSLAFVIGATVLALGLKRRGIDPAGVGLVLLVGVSAGLFGGRLFSALEAPGFFEAPVTVFLHRSGLAYLGGFLLATPAVLLAMRATNIPLLPASDALAPGLAFGYASARVGCFLAGDGCYGRPTLLPWGMTFPHGLVPTLSAQNADLRARFVAQFPGLPVPGDIPVHPAPLYEMALALLVGAFLWRLRSRPAPHGWLFCVGLSLSAVERLLVEPLRLNREWAWGLTQSQAISAVLLVLSVSAVFVLGRRRANDNSSSLSSPPYALT